MIKNLTEAVSHHGDEKLEDIFNLYAIGDDHGEYLDHQGMAKLMKQVGATPYLFIRLAIVEITVKDNPIAAKRYIDYARGFENIYFENEREELNFGIINNMAEAFLAMYKNPKKGRFYGRSKTD